MINCNENENDNGKTDHINKTYIDQDVEIETNIENIACLSKTISLCNKQHLILIWVGFLGAYKCSHTYLVLENILFSTKAPLILLMSASLNSAFTQSNRVRAV